MTHFLVAVLIFFFVLIGFLSLWCSEFLFILLISSVPILYPVPCWTRNRSLLSIAVGELTMCLPGKLMLYAEPGEQLDGSTELGCLTWRIKGVNIILPIFKGLYGCWELLDLE
ncbi:hypothetical protein HDV64DRAFT_116288 [Trichoderma sp. TUCIM 5745]